MRLLLFIFICAVTSSSGFANGNSCYALPSEANNYPIVVWLLGHTAQQQFKDAPLIDKVRGIRDAKPYLKSENLQLAEDAFALYFEDRHILIVSAPQSSQDSLTFLLD
jgi:hypothetical protein